MNPFNVIRDSLYFFQRNLRQIALLCLPLVIFEALLQQLLDNAVGPDASPIYGLVAGLLVYPLYTAALILFLDARSRGEAPLNRDLLAMSLRLWPRFALLSAVNTIAIVLGLSLYFIPGIWLIVVLAFSEYLLVLRGREPLQAIKESFALSRGRFWLTFTCILCVMGPLWLLKGLSLSIYPTPQNPVLTLIIDSAHSFLQLFTSVVLFRIYMLIGENSAND
ncbi:YciC family protein [Pseudomonas batumici]|uniref:YciC family protein n=1 Tax=Pseudomonas batumici TaxID=226910 RepID=UPI0030D3E574